MMGCLWWFPPLFCGGGGFLPVMVECLIAPPLNWHGRLKEALG